MTIISWIKGKLFNYLDKRINKWLYWIARRQNMNEYKDEDNRVVISDTQKYCDDIMVVNQKTSYMLDNRRHISSYMTRITKLVNDANRSMFKGIVVKNEVACHINYSYQYNGSNYENKYSVTATTDGFKYVPQHRTNSDEMGLVEYFVLFLENADKIEAFVKNIDATANHRTKYHDRFLEFKEHLTNLKNSLIEQKYFIAKPTEDTRYHYGVSSKFPYDWREDVAELKEELKNDVELTLIDGDLGSKGVIVCGFEWRQNSSQPLIKYNIARNSNLDEISVSTSINDFRLFSFRFVLKDLADFQERVIQLQDSVKEKQEEVLSTFKRKLARYLVASMI